MGNLHKRGDIYYADYLDRSGTRQQKSLRTKDPVVAKARLRDLELATTDRAPHQTEALDLALSYFVDVTCAAKPAGTVRCYKQKARHLSRLLGSALLDRMTRETVERYIAARLGEDASKHTIHKELVVLRGALKAAKQRDQFHKAVGDVVPEFDAEYEPRRTFITSDQFLRLTDFLVRPIGANATPAQRERWEARRRDRVFHVLLMVLASERLGEVELMRWEDVNWSRNVLNVPDGKTGSRIVPIHPELRRWLEEYAQPTGPIVEPWGNMVRDLERACTRAGVPRVTANDLRRTFASWLVQQGESLYVVSKLLGHKSTRMVEKVYGQLDEATMIRAMARLPQPRSHTGYTDGMPNGVTGGAFGTTQSAPSIQNAVENGVDSSTSVVPSPGIEPGTRGFSVSMTNGSKATPRKAKLKLVG